MMIDQADFLGYHNFNGVTASMKELQVTQTKFWMDVYLAATRGGASNHVAMMNADAANEMFKERFVPSLS